MEYRVGWGRCREEEEEEEWDGYIGMISLLTHPSTSYLYR